MSARRMLDSERIAGRRADFHVYYRRNGKLFVDAMWAKTEREAADKMRGFARELRWRVVVERVVAVGADA